MTDQTSDTLSEDELDTIAEDIPGMIALREAAHEAERTAWFADVGGPVTASLKSTAQTYLDGLGFPHTDIALVQTWEEAAGLAENPELDSLHWEAEESIRASLLDDVLSHMSEEGLTIGLNYLSAKTSPSIKSATEDLGALWDVEDEALLTAATGAAVHAVHLFALSNVAECEDTHPAKTKFRLFKAGRWPISITGNTFNLF